MLIVSILPQADEMTIGKARLNLINLLDYGFKYYIDFLGI